MKPRFRSVSAAEKVPIVEAREACLADTNEDKIDLVIGGRFDFVLLCEKRLAYNVKDGYK
jgi:hypothetical protein